jgi:hypothetical protein
MARAKTLKDRFNKQAARINAKGLTNKAGAAITTKELARRALAQAKRHHASAKDRKSSNPNIRAQVGRVQNVGTTRKSKIATGKKLRSARMSAGTNLRTGEKQSALKTGRKAIKASVRKGSTSVRSGSKALSQLAAMDPTTRRELVGGAGRRVGGSSVKGNLKNRQGTNISAQLKNARKKAKGRATASTSARRRNA